MDLVTRFILDRLLASTRASATVEGGRRVVAYGLFIKIIAVLSPALPLVLLYGMVACGARGEPLLVYGVTGGFGLLAAYMVYTALLTRLEFDDTYIHFSSPLYRDRRAPWSSLTAGGYSALMGMYWLHAPETGRIWISPLQHGWAELLRKAGASLRERTGEDPFAPPVPPA